MDWLKLVPIFIQVLSETIQAVEELFGPGTGPEKKKAVLEIIEALVTGFNLGNPQTILRWAGVMIDVIVSIFNLKGKFIKG